jgi:hypothetical protein
VTFSGQTDCITRARWGEFRDNLQSAPAYDRSREEEPMVPIRIHPVTRFLKYNAVGVLGTTLRTSTLALLHEVVGLGSLVSG